MPYRDRAGAGDGIETVATARTNAARQGEAAADAAEIIVLTQIISLPFGLQKAWRRGSQEEGGVGLYSWQCACALLMPPMSPFGLVRIIVNLFA